MKCTFSHGIVVVDFVEEFEVNLVRQVTSKCLAAHKVNPVTGIPG